MHKCFAMLQCCVTYTHNPQPTTHNTHNHKIKNQSRADPPIRRSEAGWKYGPERYYELDRGLRRTFLLLRLVKHTRHSRCVTHDDTQTHTRLIPCMAYPTLFGTNSSASTDAHLAAATRPRLLLVDMTGTAITVVTTTPTPTTPTPTTPAPRQDNLNHLRPPERGGGVPAPCSTKSWENSTTNDNRYDTPAFF